MASTRATQNAADRTLRLLAQQVGRPLDEVETPVAVVDLDRLEANLTRLQTYTDAHGIRLQPHAKTHKSTVIGARALELGAVGLTVAKTGEAEVFHEAGVTRLLVHFPTYGEDKWQRLARLAAEGLDLTLAVDGEDAAAGLSAALAKVGARASLLVELDVGLRRTGCATPGAAVDLARRLDRLAAVEVVGISCYPGHCRGDEATVARLLADVDALLVEARDGLLASGIACDRVSGGSTPTRYRTHTTCVNELRSGTYAFLDRREAPSEPLGLDACALWVEATVVSDALPGQVVIDAGTKTLTSDPHPDGGHGAIVGRPAARLHALNEEHGYLDVAEEARSPRVGEHVQVIPNHACGCVNLHDGLLGARDGVVEQVLVVHARGLVR